MVRPIADELREICEEEAIQLSCRGNECSHYRWGCGTSECREETADILIAKLTARGLEIVRKEGEGRLSEEASEISELSIEA